MRKIYSYLGMLMIVVFLSHFAFSQSDPSFSSANVSQNMEYQALIRNTSNVLVKNTLVGIRLSILKRGPFRDEVYVESYQTTTDTDGLASLLIGTGTVLSGNYSSVDWADGSLYIEIETDVKGGTKYGPPEMKELRNGLTTIYTTDKVHQFDNKPNLMVSKFQTPTSNLESRELAGCDLNTYQSATIIAPTDFPYTSPGSGVTVSASVNVGTIFNVTYSCGGNNFATAPISWWILSTTEYITLNFSEKVKNFSVVVNGTDQNEVFTFTPLTGTVNLFNFCTSGFSSAGNQLTCTSVSSTGTLITVNNPTGATQYTITHNGVANGSRISLLDCFVPNDVSVDPIEDIIACNGDYIDGISFSGSPSDVFFTWTNNTPSIGLAASGIGNINGFSATNSGNSPVVATVTVTPMTVTTTALANYPLEINLDEVNGNYSDVILSGNPTPPSPPSPGNPLCENGIYLNSENGQMIGTPNIGALNETDFTISVDFRAAGFGGYYSPIIIAGYGYRWIGICTNGDGNIGMKWNNSNISYSSTVLTPNQWYNARLTFSNNTAYLFLDGVLIYSVVTGALMTNAEYNFITNDFSNGGAFNGCIRNLIISNSTVNLGSPETFTITVNPSPDATVSASPNPICVGKTLSLNASGGVSYSWSGPIGYSSTQQNPTIANIQLNQAGVYTVAVTSSEGCSSTASVNVVVNPLPIATAGATPNPICVGQTLSLTSSSGTSYSWSGPNGFSSNIQNPTVANIQLNQAGVYNVTVTSSAGCSSTASVNVVVNPLPVAAAYAVPNPICVGKTLSLSSSGGTSYSWSGPNAFTSNLQNPSITNIQLTQAGIYTVTVTNENGCTNIASVSVVVNPLPIPTASANPNPICVGKTLSLFSSGGTSYFWNGPLGYSSSLQNPTIANIQLTQAGVYSVTVTNENGCTNTASVSVVVNPLPVATAGASPNPICVGKTLSLTSSGGTSYSWSGPAAFSSSLQNPSIANIQLSQGGIYTVTVTNVNGCTSTASVDVVVNALPNATATVSPNPVCAGELATFTANGGVAYKWSGPNGFNTDNRQFGLHMASNMAGTYYVTVTNSNGCSKTASVSITVNPAPNATASVSPNPACSGQTVTFSASGGTTYKWTGPAGFSSTLQNPTITNVQQYHSGEYSVEVTNGFGCKKTVVVGLKVYQTPAGKISYDTESTCTGSALQLYASGGNSYQWSGPAGFSSTLQNPTRPNANSTYSGLYAVVITNSSGCSVTLSVNITIRPLPTISAWTTTPDLCEGGTAFLYASGGTSYSWSGPYGYSSTFQNPIIINIPTYMTGTYTVTGANEYGCIAKANVFITVQSVNAIVNATPNPVPYGGTLYLTASGGTSYQWAGPNGFHTTQQNPIIYKFSKPNEGLYSCIVSSSAGCQDTKIILVQIKTNGIVGQEYVTEKIEGTYLQVYPNPASTSIKLDGGFAGQCDYQILNGQGQIVMIGKSTAGEQIQISTLAPGAYYIHWIYQNDNDNKISNISRFVKTN